MKPFEPPTDREAAPVSLRVIARSVDLGICVVLLFLSGLMVELIGVSLGLLPAAAYWILCDRLPRGQSVGKRFCGIRVIDGATGRPCTFVQALVRGLALCYLSFFDLFALLADQQQRFGDRLANTYVLLLQPPPPEPPSPPLRPTHIRQRDS